MAAKSFLYNPTLTRGIRNNNPGNIRKSPIKWEGKLNSSDKEFEQFINIAMGLRAMMTNLRTYQNTHGLKTIRQIINRWAPGSENNTEKYITAVAGSMSVAPNAEVDLSSKSTLISLAQAIVKHECSPDHYRITHEDYLEAYDLLPKTTTNGTAGTDSSGGSTETATIEKTKKSLNWFTIIGFVVALICSYLLFKK